MNATAVLAEPATSEPQQVADGIYRISVPVPFRGLRQVNLWLLEDGDGYTMIDCGWGDDQTRQRIDAAWDALLDGKPVTRLLVTHFHPDHAGNCAYICRRWGLTPVMTQPEWTAANLALRSLYSDDFDLRATFYAQNGLSEALLDRYRAETVLYHDGVELTDAYRRIRAGDMLRIGDRQWRILTGQGHSPDLAMLYSAEDDILIAGDQILPKITTNVSVWPWEPLADPLGEFIETLGRLDAELTAKTFVLPSHRDPFHDAHARIAELKRHHAERMDEVKALLSHDEPRAAGVLLEPLFKRELDGHQVNFAMGEALAHLNRLVFQGDVERNVDGNGIIRFSLSRARS